MIAFTVTLNRGRAEGETRAGMVVPQGKPLLTMPISHSRAPVAAVLFQSSSRLMHLRSHQKAVQVLSPYHTCRRQKGSSRFLALAWTSHYHFEVNQQMEYRSLFSLSLSLSLSSPSLCHAVFQGTCKTGGRAKDEGRVAQVHSRANYGDKVEAAQVLSYKRTVRPGCGLWAIP